MSSTRELAEKLSYERDPQRRRELKERIRKIKEEELRRKAAKRTQSGFGW